MGGIVLLDGCRHDGPGVEKVMGLHAMLEGIPNKTEQPDLPKLPEAGPRPTGIDGALRTLSDVPMRF